MLHFLIKTLQCIGGIFGVENPFVHFVRVRLWMYLCFACLFPLIYLRDMNVVMFTVLSVKYQEERRQNGVEHCGTFMFHMRCQHQIQVIRNDGNEMNDREIKKCAWQSPGDYVKCV